ncbi:MAG: Fic family protein [Endomicrobia bacterium]|nr:Fic family protein [Endomicrobiia bacterium]MCL2507431.1 Fic family protein [Endomicrobiia bacterium]
MSQIKNFEEYKKLGEPDKEKRAENWRIAIGLQQVDGLTPSKHLIKIAKENIEGKISIDDAGKQIARYYKENPAKTTKEKENKEADEVSSRAAKLLSNNTFVFSPAEYIAIHKFLFIDILDSITAGKIREYDISKDEPILNWDSVSYGRANSIRETLDYDFAQEKAFSYKGLTKQEKVEHIVKFMSGIWQIHPFGEGNTRTTAVFIIKYLRTLGFKANNDLFEENSLYFRNALVRANYNNLENGIYETMEYLNRFFGNLLLGEKNVLNNRDMQIKIGDIENKCPENTQKTPRKHPENAQKILDALAINPSASRQELAKTLRMTEDRVKWNINKLREAGTIRRVGPDKGGHWEIIKN